MAQQVKHMYVTVLIGVKANCTTKAGLSQIKLLKRNNFKTTSNEFQIPLMSLTGIWNFAFVQRTIAGEI
jgi:hypothetical protein